MCLSQPLYCAPRHRTEAKTRALSSQPLERNHLLWNPISPRWEILACAFLGPYNAPHATGHRPGHVLWAASPLKAVEAYYAAVGIFGRLGLYNAPHATGQRPGHAPWGASPLKEATCRGILLRCDRNFLRAVRESLKCSAAYWQARPPQPLAAYHSSWGWDQILNPGLSVYVAARFPLGAGKIWLWQGPTNGACPCAAS